MVMAKSFVLPRLQFLLLVLLLRAGLLPKNAMAEDEATSKSDTGAAPSRDDTAGPGTDADKPKPPVKCWHQECQGSANCLRKPVNGHGKYKATMKDCPDGYCYQGMYNYENQSLSHVTRGCATAEEVTCLKKELGHCFKQDLTGRWITDFEINGPAYIRCLRGTADRDTTSGPEPDQGRSAAEGRSGYGPGRREICLCDTDLCNNDGTSSAPTGVKQLGYSAALVGALLVSIFPIPNKLSSWLGERSG